MSNRKRPALVAALAGLAWIQTATAAPAFKVLYHERLELETRIGSGGQQHMSFDAYGRRFDLTLEPNENIGRAVPTGRTDIEPLRGTVDGQSGSWVRLTRTRGGWRGIVSDGHELYAIEPAADVAQVAIQALASPSATTPVMYRLADTLMPPDTGFCGTAADERGTAGSGRSTALMAYETLTRELATQSAQTSTGPTRQLVVGVVADNAFATHVGDDPEGAIIARMDIVDGIYSAQIGIKIALAPLTIFRTLPEPFTATTVPTDLLAEVRRYRSRSAMQLQTGVTHLMTGRELDGIIVGVAYVDSVCNGASAASLSQGTQSTIMTALIAAHELGHNFNAPHDGQPGACSTTPQTFLMAPRINFSNQFSDCSLRQIDARIATAQCLTAVAPEGVSSTQTSSGSGSGGGGGRLDIAVLALLGGALVGRWAHTLLLRRVARVGREAPRAQKANGRAADETVIKVRPDHPWRNRGARRRNSRFSRVRHTSRHRSH
jgi:hypothetical protein